MKIISIFANSKAMLSIVLSTIVMLTSCERGTDTFEARRNRNPVTTPAPEPSPEDETTTPSTSTTSQDRNNIIFQDLGGEANWPVKGMTTSYGITKSNIGGRNANRFEVRNGDPQYAGGVRAELNLYSDLTKTYPYEVWYGMSYYVPVDWVNDHPLLTSVVNQWHDEGGALKSPFDFNISGGNWLYKTRSGASVVETILAPVEKGKWIDFVFHLKFVKSGNGIVEIWKDGAKIISKAQPMGYSSATAPPFFKMGIYNWAWNAGSGQTTTSNQHILYISNFRLGNSLATYNDVAP